MTDKIKNNGPQLVKDNPAGNQKHVNQRRKDDTAPWPPVNQQPPNVDPSSKKVNILAIAIKPEGAWEQNPNLQILSSKPAIAWDWIGTVVFGKASLVIQQFILNHPEIDHYVITTSPEDSDLEKMVNEDLGIYKSPLPPSPADRAKIYDRGLTAKHFTRIIGCNHGRWELGLKRIVAREQGKLTGPFDKSEYYVCFFKEQICQQLDIPALVDDQLDRTEGCRMFGIKFIDPNTCV